MAIQYVKEIRDFLALSVQGEFSVIDVNLLEDAFETITKNQGKLVLIDFAQAERIHTAILGPLIKLKNTIEPARGRLVLCALPSDFRMILRMIHMESRFEYVESMAEFESQLSTVSPTQQKAKTVPKSEEPVIYDIKETE